MQGKVTERKQCSSLSTWAGLFFRATINSSVPAVARATDADASEKWRIAVCPIARASFRHTRWCDVLCNPRLSFEELSRGERQEGQDR